MSISGLAPLVDVCLWGMAVLALLVPVAASLPLLLGFAAGMSESPNDDHYDF